VKFVQVLCVIALGTLTACQPPNGEPADSAEAQAESEAGRQKLEAEWQAQYDDMTIRLSLSPAESDALRAAFDNMQSELTAWMEGENGKRLIELEGRIATATRNSDLAGVQSAIREATPLRESFRAQIDAHGENLLNAMSPDNRATWEALRLSDHLIELMEPLNLRQDQIAAIENNAGPALQQAKGRGEPNPPAAAFLELEKWVEANVLDAQQRDAYAAVKADRPMRSLSL
jgi:hypothetical protein